MFKPVSFGKRIAIIAAVFMVLCLCMTGCNSQGEDPAQGNQKPTVSIPPADITDAVEDFTKELEPLKYEDGEQGESPFYRVVGENNELFYEVQPKGEDEPMRLPIDSVIYIVGSPEECKVEKVSFDYTPDGWETETIEQYRIYATSNTGGVLDENGNPVVGEGAPVEDSTEDASPQEDAQPSSDPET